MRPDARKLVTLMLVLILTCGCRLMSPAESGWPTYRHDAARSGVTGADVELPLSPAWVFQARHAPQAAWDDPKPVPVEGILERRRVHFDDVFHVVADQDAAYFGSSANHKVYSVDLRTGAIRWTALTGGPVRLAPTLWRGRVLFGSDDGFVYCVRADDGKTIWRFGAAITDRKLLGHGKMISVQPVRTGVLVDDGIAYFGAGIFPAEGVFLYAVRAKDGSLVWRNDSCGEAPQSRVSPQGYPLASKDRLFVPMGRTIPGAFDRRNGRLLDTPYFGKHIGGTFAVLSDGELFTGTEEMMAYDAASSRSRHAWLQGQKLVATEDVLYLSDDRTLSAFDRAAYAPATLRYLEALNQRGGVIGRLNRLRRRRGDAEEIAKLAKKLKAEDKLVAAALAKVEASRKWSSPIEQIESLVKAGDTLFAGRRDEVVALDAVTGRTLWTGKVDGAAKGLAAAAGRLLVSTDTGAITCFGPANAAPAERIIEPVKASPWPTDRMTPIYESTAQAILKETGIRKGYCLVLGCETGRLAFELAKRSELMIYATDPDPAKVEGARAALDAAGLLGARVWVDEAPLTQVPYSDYFANLIVSERTLLRGELPDPAETCRMLKPRGGVAFVGQPAGASGVTALKPEAARAWINAPALKGVKSVRTPGPWAKVLRGPLPGAGKWTHQYADPGNTACSDDVAVKAPFGLLWFGRPGPGEMANRHRRAAAPLALDGRLFIQGLNVVMAYDAYNGVKLWERRLRMPHERKTPLIPRLNASHEFSNFSAGAGSLFVVSEGRCHRLRPATGDLLQTYSVPKAADGRAGNWGYVACVGNLLYGSRIQDRARSDRLFALDVATGRPRWTYAGTSFRHAAIAISGGRVFLADAGVTPAQRQAALKDRTAKMKGLQGGALAKAQADLKKADVRRIVALDAATGQQVWERAVDLTGCGGGVLGAISHNGVLLFFGVHLDGHLWRQFFAGQFESRRVLALSAADGSTLWSKTIGYRVRPLVIGDTLHAEPWAFDLHTGKPRNRTHPITGEPGPWQFARPGHHCGCPAASPNNLFFRSYTIAYYDLIGDSGTMHFGSIRPGCWINFIPANGLLMVPEASSGCMCPFPNMCTVVFQPTKRRRGWAMFSAPGPVTPVKRLAVNLGAPGDRKDETGTIWLGYPRPVRGRLVLQLPVRHVLGPGGRFFRRSPETAGIGRAARPWVFASGCKGLRCLVVPLVGETDPPAVYTVRLLFAEPIHDQPGRRVFDVKIQGRTVLESFDIAAEAGGRNVAVVKEVTGLDIRRSLRIDLVPKGGRSGIEHEPVLNGIEVIRTHAFPGKVIAPHYVLQDDALEQTQNVRIINRSDKELVGTLRAGPCPGLTVEPPVATMRVAARSEGTVRLTLRAGKNTPAGQYTVGLTLTALGERLSYKTQATIRHFADRRESVVKASADTYGHEQRPAKVFGTGTLLLCDGGFHQMLDGTHAVAYLRFKLDVPGRPVKARLRLHVPKGEPSAASIDAGRVRLVAGPWQEGKVTYKDRPPLGAEVGKIGPVQLGQTVTVPLTASLAGLKELNLALDPVVVDNAFFYSREGKRPPELVIEYVPAK